jgi:eukaryotic-like serine/threonine-protein kinase
LTLSNGPDVELLAALALARAGESARPQVLMGKLNQQHPLDTMLQHYWLPAIRAALELEKGNAQAAIDLLQSTSAYDLGTPIQFTLGTMYPVYLRGLAYLSARQPTLAAGEFRNILEHHGLVANFPLGALAHLQLARALAASGDTAAARKEYQDFFALWKDADADIPILNQARSEYAKLA